MKHPFIRGFFFAPIPLQAENGIISVEDAQTANAKALCAMSHNTRYELQRGTRETRIDQVGTLPAINHWGEEFQIHLDNGGVINGLDPSGSGQKISFVVHALEVGSISIKFASPITISGNNNTVTMSAVHNFVEFVSRKTAAGYRWVPTSESGTTYSTT